MRDLIFVSLENWDEVWRRNQFLCAELARRFPKQKILFVGQPCPVSRKNKFTENGQTVEAHPNITLINPLKLVPNRVRGGVQINQWSMQQQIRRWVRRLAIDHPLLWLNPYDSGHLRGKLGETATIYDITDDWELASMPAQQKESLVQQDRQLCRDADLVIVCSAALEQSRHAFCKRILLLPNGVDADHYSRITHEPRRISARQWNAPVFGYTGTLHQDRVDTDLIIALAQAFPKGSVVLVGPNSLTDVLTQRLLKEANIFLTGSVPYAEIPKYMTTFDVCIVPHCESAFTESLNPIKLWEYLASGKPVASTNVAGFRDFRTLCHIGSGTENFIAACRNALTEGTEQSALRRDAARQNSWQSRVDCLLATLPQSGVIERL